MLRKRGTRSMAALAVLLAGPLAAEAAGRGGPEAGAPWLWPRLETVWSWVQAVFWAESDKGICVDPDGATAESDAGHSVDPNGATAESDAGHSIDPDGATAESDKGSSIDPNG